MSRPASAGVERSQAEPALAPFAFPAPERFAYGDPIA